MKNEKSNDLSEILEAESETQKRQEGFIFYESFEKAIRETLSIKNQLIAYKAIVDYGLNFRVAENLPKPVMAILLMAIPQIDNNYQLRINGHKGKKYGVQGAEYGVSGGRPKKIDVPAKEKPIQQNQSTARDPFDEPEPFPEGCDF